MPGPIYRLHRLGPRADDDGDAHAGRRPQGPHLPAALDRRRRPGRVPRVPRPAGRGLPRRDPRPAAGPARPGARRLGRRRHLDRPRLGGVSPVLVPGTDVVLLPGVATSPRTTPRASAMPSRASSTGSAPRASGTMQGSRPARAALPARRRDPPDRGRVGDRRAGRALHGEVAHPLVAGVADHSGFTVAPAPRWQPPGRLRGRVRDARAGRARPPRGRGGARARAGRAPRARRPDLTAPTIRRSRCGDDARSHRARGLHALRRADLGCRSRRVLRADDATLLFGVPVARIRPAAFGVYVANTLSSGDLAVGGQARAIARTVLDPRAPAAEADVHSDGARHRGVAAGAAGRALRAVCVGPGRTRVPTRRGRQQARRPAVRGAAPVRASRCACSGPRTPSRAGG